jgi:hypothetical protein
MSASQSSAVLALIGAFVITGGGYWLLDIHFGLGMPWWSYAVIFFCALGSGYAEALKQAAHKRQAGGG